MNTVPKYPAFVTGSNQSAARECLLLPGWSVIFHYSRDETVLVQRSTNVGYLRLHHTLSTITTIQSGPNQSSGILPDQAISFAASSTSST